MSENYMFRSDVNVKGTIRSTEQGTLIGTIKPSNPAQGDICIENGVAMRYDGSAWVEAETRFDSLGKRIDTVDSKADANTEEISTLSTRVTSNTASINELSAKVDNGTKLNDTQMQAVNSGITAAKVSTYDGYATEIAGKQGALTSAQLAAADSGITKSKVGTYDGYAGTISSKAAQTDVDNLRTDLTNLQGTVTGLGSSKLDATATAVKATSDGNGNVIADTYVTRTDLDSRGYITSSDVNVDLTDYYKKSETYTKAEVDSLAALHLTITKADALPASGEGNRIYLVPNPEGVDKNIFDEYIWVDDKWELIGTTETVDEPEDLSIYATKSELSTELAKYTKTADVDSKISTVEGKVSAVEAKIPDATAYQAKCIRASGVSIACTTSDSTYTDFPYKGTWTNSDVGADDTAVVTFSVADATSGNLAPVCETYAGGVYVYAKASMTVEGVSILVVKG